MTSTPSINRLLGIPALVLSPALAFAFAAPLQGQTEGAAVSLPLGSAAPDVALEDLNGETVELNQLIGGRPAIVEFWASWCENCEALQPQLDEIQARYGDDLAVIAVAVGVAQTRRRVRRHAEAHGAAYPYLWDGDGAAVRAYDALATSIVVMLDADGLVAYTGVGAEQDLVGAAERLLAG